jgi:hypothetical protein
MYYMFRPTVAIIRYTEPLLSPFRLSIHVFSSVRHCCNILAKTEMRRQIWFQLTNTKFHESPFSGFPNRYIVWRAGRIQSSQQTLGTVANAHKHSLDFIVSGRTAHQTDFQLTKWRCSEWFTGRWIVPDCVHVFNNDAGSIFSSASFRSSFLPHLNLPQSSFLFSPLSFYSLHVFHCRFFGCAISS